MDLSSQKMYFTEYDNYHSPSIPDGGRIMRANLDGTGLETVLQVFGDNMGFPGSTLSDIEIDTINDKIYWTDQSTNKIQRANLDGNNLEILVDAWGRNLALDLVGGKIYWGYPHSGIHRANLDGSGSELFLANNWDVHGLDFGHSTSVPIPEPPQCSC